MVQRKPLIVFSSVPRSVDIRADVGEPRFTGDTFHCRIANEVCTMRLPLVEDGMFRNRQVLIGRFNDCMEFAPVLEDRDAISMVIEKAMDNYIKAYAALGSEGNEQRARLIGERLKSMKMLRHGADYAINFPGAFIMVSAITALLDFSVSRTLDVGYYDFSTTPLRTSIRDTTGETCLMLPGGLSIAISPKS